MSMYSYLESAVLSLIKKNFYFAYSQLAPDVVQERVSAFLAKGGSKLDELNAYRLPSLSKSNHVVVFAYNKGCWQVHPKNYDYLRTSADVVIWDPSEFTPTQYQKDLQAVIQKVRSVHPEKTITVFGHCAGVDPIIGAAQELKDENMKLILDRGFGNVLKLAKGLTWFSSIPIINSLLQRYFSCGEESRIRDIPGNILFLQSDVDQLLKWGKQDLTADLMAARGYRTNDKTIHLPNNDHWSPWDQSVHRQVYDFIGLKGVDVSSFPEEIESPSFFARNILPCLIYRGC